MSKSPYDFQYHLQNEFFPTLKKPHIRGGPSLGKRKKIIQEAVDALQIYGTMNVTAASDLRYRFETTYRSFFKSPLPANTPTAGVQLARMRLVEKKFFALEEKFRLLDYWQAVAVGYAEPDFGEDGAHWEKHVFLAYTDPTKVRPVLELMLDDAANVLAKQQFTADMNTWKGADYSVNKSFTKEGMARTLCFDAQARAGIMLKGQMDMQYSGIKVHGDAEFFAGIMGKVGAKAVLDQTGVSLKGNIEAELGIHFKANVNCDIFDVLDMGLEVDALAGAIFKAEGELTVNYQGVAVKVSAEVFAGVRASATAHGTLKIGGRQVTKAKITGTVMAGAGASAGAQFKCGLFGDVSFGAKAGSVLGVGGQVDTAITVDFKAIYWGAANLIWTYANEHGFNNRARVHFLPVEENVQMALLAREQLWKMMSEAYLQHSAEADILERWKMIEKRVGPYAKEYK